MATIYACETAEQAGGLLRRLFNNDLSLISTAMGEISAKRGSENEHRQVVDRTRERLVGQLYIMRRKLAHSGNTPDALKVGELLVMLIDENVARKSVRVAINDKMVELFPPQS